MHRWLMMIGTWRIICAESYIWLVVWNMNFMTFPSYWECHHPNWLSYFSEGVVGIPPTSFFLHFSKPPTSIIDIPYTLWLFNVASGKWPIYRWFTMVYRLKSGGEKPPTSSRHPKAARSELRPDARVLTEILWLHPSRWNQPPDLVPTMGSL